MQILPIQVFIDVRQLAVAKQISKSTFFCMVRQLSHLLFCLFCSRLEKKTNTHICIYCILNIFCLGERPEAMQTGTSTYFADKSYIMHTLLVATIVSIYNIFRDYYSSIIIIEHSSFDYIT